MAKSIIKYSLKILIIISINLLIIVPVLFFLILPREYNAILPVYLDSISFPILTVFIIVQIFFLFLLNKKKHAFTKLISVYFLLYAVPLILEHPKLMNQEVLYIKPIGAKYFYASIEYHNSIPNQMKYEIYKSIIDLYSPCILNDSLVNGIDCKYNSSKIYLGDTILNKLCDDWSIVQNSNIIFSKSPDVQNPDSVIPSGYKGILTLTPIKLVGNKIIVGYNLYCGILCGRCNYYECIKENDKWKLVVIGPIWVS